MVSKEIIIDWFTEMFFIKEAYFVKRDKEEREFYKNMSDYQKIELRLTESNYQKVLKEIKEIEEYEKMTTEINQEIA